MARRKWERELHLLDDSCIPEEQLERARILESICIELDTQPTPSTQLTVLARKASDILASLAGYAGRSIKGKTLERIWYEWKNTGRNFKTLIDKRYFKLQLDESKRPHITLHPESLSPNKANELITWDEFASIIGDIHSELLPLGKWRTSYGNSKMFADSQYDKLMRSAVFSVINGEKITEMPQEAKVQLFFRLIWAFYKIVEKRDKEKNAQVTKQEAVAYLSNLITKKWHRTANDWLFQACNIKSFFE